MANRRKHYLVNKPLQFRYVFYIVATLVVVSGAGILGTYYGIWASVLDAFSGPSIRQTMTTAAQIQEYDEARRFQAGDLSRSPLRLFKETERMSARQREIIRDILNETNRRLIGWGMILLFFLGWGSLFLTHKIAGPLYRLRKSCRELGAGDLAIRIHLRKFDEAQDVARDFNQMAASLDATFSTLKRIIRTLPPTHEAKELEKALGRFRTSSD